MSESLGLSRVHFAFRQGGGISNPLQPDKREQKKINRGSSSGSHLVGFGMPTNTTAAYVVAAANGLASDAARGIQVCPSPFPNDTPHCRGRGGPGWTGWTGDGGVRGPEGGRVKRVRSRPGACEMTRCDKMRLCWKYCLSCVLAMTCESYW